MTNQDKCLHLLLGQLVVDEEMGTGKMIVKFYKCLDCGEIISPEEITIIPPSKEFEKLFAIND